MLNRGWRLTLTLLCASFLLACPARAEELASATELTPQEMERASYLYFDRCAGCHGVLRKGATGPALTVKETSEIGQGMLRSFISDGTEAGMPAFLQEGILSAEEVDLLSRFLLKEPPSPPEMSMEKIKQSWKVAVPPDQRPKAPLHTRNWQNFMGVVLRDAGKVAIIDGDTKELVSLIGTGHAVHILRSSATGRYFYSIGRDGKVTLIDLWMNPPQMVAELKVCYDARSVESSKYKGPAGDFLDRYLVVGGYWPPLLAVLDGQTLEPLKLLSTRGYTYDSGEYVQEARVASIVASHHDPLWVVNIKETGQTWLVDYSDIKNLKVCMIETERFLHDGGWESTKRYFIVAANMRDRLAVVDTVDRKLVTLVDVGTKPHPGRGANLVHPEFGPLWCTGHLGDNSLAFIGTDPVNYPQHAWKVVARPRMPGDAGGNLFVKTHPGSKWIFADRPLAPDPAQNRKIYVFDKNTLQFAREIEIPVSYARAKPVHFDFNKAGDEIWVSLWGASKTEPTAILIYDQATLNLKHEIKGDWVITPTGHFNVHNTAGDVY